MADTTQIDKKDENNRLAREHAAYEAAQRLIAETRAVFESRGFQTEMKREFVPPVLRVTAPDDTIYEIHVRTVQPPFSEAPPKPSQGGF